jgi:8-oxo-dGTP diphosphatase
MNSHSVEMRPKVGAGIMLLRHNRVLLGKRKNAHGMGTYGRCGGHVEFRETLVQAARREATEEAGILVRDLEFACVSNIISGNTHYLDVEFKCLAFEGEPTVPRHSEVEAWARYDLHALPTPLFPAVELAIKSFMTGQVYNP